MRGVNLAGAVTWAFEFEDQPWFAGFRELATNGVDKPVLNVFRMFGKLSGKTLAVSSSGSQEVTAIEANGVTGEPDINAIAVRKAREVDVLVWNYHDDDVAATPEQIELAVSGIATPRASVLQYRMDGNHSNSYTAWLAMGSPQHPSPEQVEQLREAGALRPHQSKQLNTDRASLLRFSTFLPRQGVLLYCIRW
jgi:xylan 1,4-beta-xylosidase